MNYSKTATMHSEIAEIIREVDTTPRETLRLVEGEATLALQKQTLDSGIRENEWNNIKDEAIAVLSECVSPNTSAKRKTGLVMGYVQSGKTLSFTTVAALARDNNYQMIIVITGASLNLRDQSTQRLEKDLLLTSKSARRWYHFKSDEFNESDYTVIRDILADWQDSTHDEWLARQTVLITVMKHHQHLQDLADILSKLKLSDVPTLVIDDEGDQASLNTLVKRREASTTYQRILSLRECLPHHTFLQYTATPQALLLINLIDILSPDFAKVLTPGAQYTGGREFFREGSNRICTIPDSDIPTKDNPLDGPPESLLQAMGIFFLGVAAAYLLEDKNPEGNRSMMVHPSRETFQHGRYLVWVNSVKRHWSEVLDLNEDDSDRIDLLEEFERSYNDLACTVPEMPPFERLIPILSRVIRKTRPHSVNAVSGKTPNIPWSNAYAHILIGGQAMDRGFTVEGLTVTYMPRGKGSGNADTIQQRARFFGYKNDIFGFCRVFLETNVRDAYRKYITHEEDIRDRLIAHGKTGKPLDEWKRAFFLDKTLRPTRQNILDIGYIRVKSKGQWYDLKAPHDSPEVNRLVVKEFLQKLSFQDDEGHPNRTKWEIHHQAEVSLIKACEELLMRFQISRLVDTQKFTGMHLQISHYLDSHPDALCTVLHMSRGKPRNRSLHGKRKEKEVVRLFQGRNGDRYPGDRNKKIPSRVTIQIHVLHLECENGVIIKNVPTLAIWIPKEISPDSIFQNQGGTLIGY